MSPDWSDAEIEKRAAHVASAVSKAGDRSRNEAELRIAVNPILKQFAADASLEVDDRHERLVGRGRMDSVYGRVVIEYKDPGLLNAKNSAAQNRRAVSQVREYLKELARRENQEISRMVGVVLDGLRVLFVRCRRGQWETSPPRPVDQASVTELLLRLRSLRGKALLPENLVADFGGSEARGRFAASDIAARCVSALYRALADSESPKVGALFSQWRLLFSEVCGYEFASARLDLEGLAASYGVVLKEVGRRKRGRTSEQAERLFFSIHTYYATVITLLAAEIVTYYMGQRFFPSYLGKLEAAGGDQLRAELAELHSTGGIFGQVGIANFLEGDFFAWHLEAWSQEIAEAMQTLVRALRLYDPATFQVEPDETRDLLKKLYQYLLPRKLRHDLGEYYTPDWLAELVLDEIGFRGDPGKRILDPACGSGTFLALEIRRAKEWVKDKQWGDREALEAILRGIVGFDLNPLAVITARTNYLIALGELLRYRKGPVEIPVYLCDAVLTPAEARQLSLRRSFPLGTAVGVLEVPVACNTQERVAGLARLLEEAVRGGYRRAEFLVRAESEIGLTPVEFEESHEVLAGLYDGLSAVAAAGKNGVWARIIKNFFAPVFTVAERHFDFLAGNLPWINWESLPDHYRKSTQGLWEDYGLFTLKGWRARMGGGKKDISALFFSVAADKYLAHNGKLGFLVTQTLLKSAGAGEGFRRFELPASPGRHRVGLRVLGVQDLVEVKPFEGAANRTAAVIAAKGDKTRFPVAYTVWLRKQGGRIPEDSTLAEAESRCLRRQHVARPIAAKRGAPWTTGEPAVLEAAAKALGSSHYRARAGTTTWLNGVYWVRVLERLPDGNLLIENLYDVGKIVVRQVQVSVEPDLVYPLLRGRDIAMWRAAPSDCILVAQDPATRKGYEESEMRVSWPLTYAYLRRFEKELRQRSGFRKYFEATDPFYSMYNVGPQTSAPLKVVWRELATGMAAAVCAPVASHALGERPCVPDHTVIAVSVQTACEGHYLCALLNSSPSRWIAQSYLHLHASPHVLNHVKIPRFDGADRRHLRLAELSAEAHVATAGDEATITSIQAEVDEVAAELWDIGGAEIRLLRDALGYSGGKAQEPEERE